MPLSASRLSAAIKAALISNPDTGAIEGDATTAFCDVIAQAVVAEITANAAVVPTLLVAPPGGGPVTGTGGVT